MTYALIDDGMVANLINLHPMNAGDFADAVAVKGLPVHVGDVLIDGKFYRPDGSAVVAFDESAVLEMADMKAALNNLGVYADE